MTKQQPSSFIIAISGKGGVGKTSLTALLIDEIARAGYAGPLLAVDGDPAATLNFALGLEPPTATVADIRDTVNLDAGTVRALPEGVTPADHVRGELLNAGVIRRSVLRGMQLDLLAMGRSEGRGCYCAVNKALGTVLPDLAGAYPLVILDNEAGIEHLNRYRLHRADRFVVVQTPSRAAQAVSQRILATADEVGMEIGEAVLIINRTAHYSGIPDPDGVPDIITLADSDSLRACEAADRPIVALLDEDPLRATLAPLAQDALRHANLGG